MNKRILLPISLLLCLASCATYRVEGTTSVPTLNGKKVYIRVPGETDWMDVDSCEIVHGVFCMDGEVDSVMIGTLFLEGEIEGLMPVILEKGKIAVSIENTGLKAGGTPLNDRLYAFIHSKNALEQRLSEASHREMQLIMEGMSADEANATVQEEYEALVTEMNRLIVDFVTENFGNPLAEEVFAMYCQSFPNPTLTPVIEEILDKAPVSFKESDFVKEYLSAAEQQ